MRVALLAVALVALAGCTSPVPRSEWPVKDDPLFGAAVWIDAPEGYGSGCIVHSSRERGTFVLTAAHMISDRDGYVLAPDELREVRVGVFALSHFADPGEEYVEYPVEVVATTAQPRPEEPNLEIAALVNNLGLMNGRDFAVLRLRTDRLFRFCPIYAGDPAVLQDSAGCVLAVAPEMYPHRLDATCKPDHILCLDGQHGNSGAPMIVEGRVVGLFNYLVHGPGPAKLQEFLRDSPDAKFLLDRP